MPASLEYLERCATETGYRDAAPRRITLSAIRMNEASQTGAAVLQVRPHPGTRSCRYNTSVLVNIYRRFDRPLMTRPNPKPKSAPASRNRARTKPEARSALKPSLASKGRSTTKPAARSTTIAKATPKSNAAAKSPAGAKTSSRSKAAVQVRSPIEAVLDRGIVRSRDLEALGIGRPRLRELVASGALQRLARGVYIAADHELTEKHSLAVAATLVPHGVVCLLSALVFHGLTVQNPWEVWMAIDPWSRKPSQAVPPLRIVRFSGEALAFGVETHHIEGVAVKVYNVAKTVADLFKYRNKIGLDVAIEALRETIGSRRATPDELLRAAKVCRVEHVMRPYLEALL